ncbi:MAG: ABC transporter ATP-binding protein [Pseudonocardiales bacterium]|nr:MAG: ABC transporter ATP-binding protein [Pseudonocardiales bacterium]
MPRSSRARIARVAASAAVGLASVATVALTVAPDGAAEPAFTTQTLHFAVQVGPSLSQSCDVVGVLYTPATASSAARVPAILTTNGFGGSAADQAPFAEQEAGRGYVVLSYSGLGFGGSGCKITLDDPGYDGVAASQLISYLGGAPRIAYTDQAHTVAAPTLNVVMHDAIDHAGVASAFDPRVGMWGGSYGGQVQFAAASVDARLDAINPQITWNDLSYSLDPNNTGQVRGVTTSNPGATKSSWAAGFSAKGIFDGVQYAQNDPSRLIGCPNFVDFVCPALVSAGATGYLAPADVAALQHASVESYLAKVRIPVLLDQGQVDTLFNLNEAIATYRALKAQGTPVAMLWREQGHSGGTPSATGRAYEDARIQSWFDHYLKGLPVSTGSAFAYYQDWTGTFAEAASYPVASTSRYYLSGANTLVGNRNRVTSGSQSLVTPPAGVPTSLGGLDALGSTVPVPLDLPDTNLPGTYVHWQTPALTKPVTVVGSPVLDVQISAPTAVLTSALGPAGQVVLFAKVYDVAPDGTASLIHGLVAPVRVADPTRAVHITLPGIAHRFTVGHRIEIMLAGGDLNYRGGLTPTLVSVSTGVTGQALTLPVVG